MNQKIFFIAFTIILSFGSFCYAQTIDPTSNTNNNQDYDDEFAAFESEFGKSQDLIYDPFESVNRKIYSFNDVIDRYAMEPIAQAYRNYIPRSMRKSVRNFTTNLSLPISTINSFAQGKLNNGLATFSNFLINSTLGIGGLFDVAGNKNITYNPEDFGQTLGHYGLNSGPYLVLPILGPSSGRDFAGYAVDRSTDPMGFNVWQIGGSTNAIDIDIRTSVALTDAIDLREALLDTVDGLRKDSFDLYAAMRSSYLQHRQAKINK